CLAPAQLTPADRKGGGRIARSALGSGSSLSEVGAIPDRVRHLLGELLLGPDDVGGIVLGDRDQGLVDEIVRRYAEASGFGVEKVVDLLGGDTDAAVDDAALQLAQRQLLADLLAGAEIASRCFQRTDVFVKTEAILLGEALHDTVDSIVVIPDAHALSHLHLQAFHNKGFQDLALQLGSRRQRSPARLSLGPNLLQTQVQLTLQDDPFIDDGGDLIQHLPLRGSRLTEHHCQQCEGGECAEPAQQGRQGGPQWIVAEKCCLAHLYSYSLKPRMPSLSRLLIPPPLMLPKPLRVSWKNTPLLVSSCNRKNSSSSIHSLAIRRIVVQQLLYSTPAKVSRFLLLL